MKTVLTVVVTVLVVGVVAGAVVYSGELLNFAGDEPHPSVIEGFIGAARERFIAQRAADIDVPDLDEPHRVASGAAHYAPMCAGCHLAPAAKDTEIRRGLYPQPPNLAQPGQHAGHDHGEMTQAARRQFWIIKHGVKMTAMPAWGATHDDESIWDLVAFLQKLPELSPEEYQVMTVREGAQSHGATDHIDPPGSPPHRHGGQGLTPEKTSEDQHSHEH